MDNISINVLASNTKEIKTDTVNFKASKNTSREPQKSFDSQLSQVKDKDANVSKSAIKSTGKEVVKDITGNRPIDIKNLDDDNAEEVVCQMILSLISNVLEIPVENIEQTLEDMGITALDLLDETIFKEFLIKTYPSYNEEQLLFNADELKAISKLFARFEQIREVIYENHGDLLVEKVVVEGEVVKTDVTRMENLSQVIVMPKEGTVEPRIKDIAGEETVFEGNLAEEPPLNYNQSGLGLNIPIHAFNSTADTKLWHLQNQSSNEMNLADQHFLSQQIIRKLDIASTQDGKEITMELSPKELGKLSIKLVESNGVFVANIRVESEKTKELLINEVSQLKDTLEKQGMLVGEVRVDIRQNPHQSQMEQQKQKSTRRIQELIDKHLVEEQTEYIQFNESTGEIVETEVNYTV